MASTIQDVMTTHITTCPPTATIADAARLMRDRDIGDVLVTDDEGHLAGIVTDRDLVVRCLADGATGEEVLANAYSTDVSYLTPDSSIDAAVEMMRDQSLRRLPVVDHGQPIGIVSLGDLAIERDPSSALGDISAAAPNR